MSGTSSSVFCSANCATANEVDTTVPGFGARTGSDLARGLGTIDAATYPAAEARFVAVMARR